MNSASRCHLPMHGTFNIAMSSAPSPERPLSAAVSAAEHAHDQASRPALEVDVALTAEAPALAWRVLRLLNGYRILVGVFLLVLFYISDAPRIVGANHPVLFQSTALLYLALGAIAGITIDRRWPALGLQVFIQISVDIIAITTLMHASGGVSSGLGILLVVSVGAASLTLPRRYAVLLAAIGALAILFQQTLIKLAGTSTVAEYTPAGVLGAIIFIIALAAHPLARRIRESEALARQRGLDLANLAELNEYIIQHLRESIVVVDAENRIRLINESASQQLGARDYTPGEPLESVSPKLLSLLELWRQDPQQLEQSTLTFVAADRSTIIHPHFAPIGTTEPPALLVFLEDTSLLAERVQQSKLASLGRLSASIAHEIRNPVGAMSHAGQLLAESAALGPDERRMTEIIQKNASRVSSIIDNVLQLSRRDSTQPERLILTEWLRDFRGEFIRTLQLDGDRVSLVSEDEGVEVRMDPTHLHQVLWNLCENAVKYADRSPTELRVGRIRFTRRPYLEVRDSGPGIDEQTAERIFEPFFTGDHGGTGLGLYISRELCEFNGATLLYEPRQGGGSIFRIIFADPQRWEA